MAVLTVVCQWGFESCFQDGFGTTVAQDACTTVNVIHNEVSAPVAIMAPLAASDAEVLPATDVVAKLLGGRRCVAA